MISDENFTNGLLDHFLEMLRVFLGEGEQGEGGGRVFGISYCHCGPSSSSFPCSLSLVGHSS